MSITPIRERLTCRGRVYGRKQNHLRKFLQMVQYTLKVFRFDVFEYIATDDQLGRYRIVGVLGPARIVSLIRKVAFWFQGRAERLAAPASIVKYVVDLQPVDHASDHWPVLCPDYPVASRVVELSLLLRVIR